LFEQPAGPRYLPRPNDAGDVPMKLYTAPLSLFARKIEIALAEKRIEFERVLVPYSQNEGYKPKHPDVLAANPKGQVPVLVDRDLTLYDSTVIFEYLEDAYPTPPLYPRGAVARARCRQAELFADEVMMSSLRPLMYRNEGPIANGDRRESLRARAREAEAMIAENFAALDRQLVDGGYFCGTLSVADIATFMQVLYVQRLAGPGIEGYPGLAAWYSRLTARPSFARQLTEIAAADRELSFPVEV
jgi:glutathione S-transferase